MQTALEVPIGAPYTKYVLSTFWRRAAALLIDNIVVLITAGIAAALLRIVGVHLASYVARVPVWLAYFVYFNGRGDPLGKVLLGIRVVDAAADPPGLKRAAIRVVVPGVASSLSLPAVFAEAEDSSILRWRS